MHTNSTRGFHRDTRIDLMKEFTICESLSDTESPYMTILREPRSYGAMVGDFLIRQGMLRPGSTIVELGGGYGSLMHGLLEAHGRLIRKVFMVDLSKTLLKRQRDRLLDYPGQVSFINADIHELIHAFRGVDLVIVNEVIGDLDTLTGLDPQHLSGEAFALVTRYGLEHPAREGFSLNSGAISLVEALCSQGIPAFLSEHSCDPLMPKDMPYLARGLALDSFPREIPLSGHSEYTIRFSHLMRVGRSFGRKTASGPLIDLLGITDSPALRFMFLGNACSTEKQAVTSEFLDHVREYRWLTLE